MCMLYQNRKWILVFSIIVSMASVAVGQQKQRTGSLVGTVTFASENGLATIGFSPDTSIVLMFENKEMTIVSDENGDYFPALPVGKYCISYVESSDGTRLKLRPSQRKAFKIFENKTTRFDISLSQ